MDKAERAHIEQLERTVHRLWQVQENVSMELRTVSQQLELLMSRSDRRNRA
jgi:archaellum component FlaC